MNKKDQTCSSPCLSVSVANRTSRLGARELDRRDVIKSGVAGLVTLWAAPVFAGQQQAAGAPGNGDRIMAALKGLGGNPKVHTVFNTHYHLAQTGNNEAFAAAGAKIVAHDRTRQWMSVDYWLPDESRYQKARP